MLLEFILPNCTYDKMRFFVCVPTLAYNNNKRQQRQHNANNNNQGIKLTAHESRTFRRISCQSLCQPSWTTWRRAARIPNTQSTAWGRTQQKPSKHCFAEDNDGSCMCVRALVASVLKYYTGMATPLTFPPTTEKIKSIKVIVKYYDKYRNLWSSQLTTNKNCVLGSYRQYTSGRET